MEPTELEIEISATIKARDELRASGHTKALSHAQDDLRYLIEKQKNVHN